MQKIQFEKKQDDKGAVVQMTEEQRTRCHEIFEFYGKETEKLKTFEEIGEFITAICGNDQEEIMTEMADLCICIEHVAYMHNIYTEDLIKEIEYKLDRQYRRMKNEQEIGS